ncbi:MAG TPA: hypothetical protein VNP72_01520 [Longimicrobium sp.]|nr:hypothetical protein [Longimicrobium sp.]
MPWTLKQADGTHTQIGTSAGNRQDEDNGTFWVTGWNQAARDAVDVDGSYFLQAPNESHWKSVEVKEKGGGGAGGIRFKLNT